MTNSDAKTETFHQAAMRLRESDLERSVKELERLADTHAGSSHYLSQEAYKLGLKYAIREIEEWELLSTKAHKETPYANPEEAEREYQNQKNLLRVIKAALVRRYEGAP